MNDADARTPAPPAPRRGRPRKSAEQRSESQRHADVLREAARLFRTQGFDATSTRDLLIWLVVMVVAMLLFIMLQMRSFAGTFMVVATAPLGLIGAVAAVILLAGTKLLIVDKVLNVSASPLGTKTDTTIGFGPLALILIVSGALLGALGSGITLRRFLKV